MALVDIGVNFTSNKFDNVDEMIKSANDNNVKYIIGISNCVLDIPKNLSICGRTSDVYCTAGVHPHQVKHLNDERFNNLETFIKTNNGKIVAIGECGLDYNRNFSTPEDQRFWFKKQLDLAASYDLPLYLHERDAHDDLKAILKAHSHDFKNRAIVHCFTGGWKELKVYLEMGYFIGVTGWICDDVRAKELIAGLTTAIKDDTLKDVILNKIMTETDSPWLYPKNIVGKRPKYNSPANVKHVVNKLCDVLGLSYDEMVKISFDNCEKFFALNGK